MHIHTCSCFYLLYRLAYIYLLDILYSVSQYLYAIFAPVKYGCELHPTCDGVSVIATMRFWKGIKKIEPRTFILCVSLESRKNATLCCFTVQFKSVSDPCFFFLVRLVGVTESGAQCFDKMTRLLAIGTCAKSSQLVVL
jgi:hypothetical protein